MVKEGEHRNQAPGYRDNQEPARDYHPQPRPPSAGSGPCSRAPIQEYLSSHGIPLANSVYWNSLDAASAFSTRLLIDVSIHKLCADQPADDRPDDAQGDGNCRMAAVRTSDGSEALRVSRPKVVALASYEE
jgi:hypothetical protein